MSRNESFKRSHLESFGVDDETTVDKRKGDSAYISSLNRFLKDYEFELFFKRENNECIDSNCKIFGFKKNSHMSYGALEFARCLIEGKTHSIVRMRFFREIESVHTEIMNNFLFYFPELLKQNQFKDQHFWLVSSDKMEEWKQKIRVQKLKAISPVNDIKLNYYVSVKLSNYGQKTGFCHFIGEYPNTSKIFVGVELFESLTKEQLAMEESIISNDQRINCLFGGQGVYAPIDLISIPNHAIARGSDKFKENHSIKQFCGVFHDPKFLQDVIRQEKPPEDLGYDLKHAIEVDLASEIGTHNWNKPTGVCRFIGQHTHTKEYYIGVELDEKLFHVAVTNGTFPATKDGVKFFKCENYRGVLLPRNRVQLDHRLVQAEIIMQQKVKDLPAKHKQEEVVCEEMESTRLSLTSNDYVNKFIGDNGIQGKLNSCYMDATLFAMFAFNDTFDSILSQGLDNTKSTVTLLKETVVNVLRRKAYVPQVNMIAFRGDFEKNSGSSGMTEDQKDPEEFLSFLFEKLCHIPSLLYFADGDSTNILQLFFFCEDLSSNLRVTKMIEKTFEMLGNCQFKVAPVNLIMQIPREGGKYIGFKSVGLDLTLDLHEYVENKLAGDFNCCRSCGTASCASLYCPLCFATVCKSCVNRNDDRLCCHRHVQQPYSSLLYKAVYEMQLHAVLCIDVSHYITFVRLPQEVSADATTCLEQRRWLYFDSMGKREGDINIPEIRQVDNLENWVEKSIHAENIFHFPTDDHKRLVTNAYTLFYRNERLAVYD